MDYNLVYLIMKESEFNKRRDELRSKIGEGDTLLEKIMSVERFFNFMRTKSHNGYWNSKYRKDKYLLLSNGMTIPYYNGL